MMTYVRVRFPLVEPIINKDTIRWQCDNCGWIGNYPLIEHRGGSGALRNYICPKCGNYNEENPFIIFEIRIIPRSTARLREFNQNTIRAEQDPGKR